MRKVLAAALCAALLLGAVPAMAISASAEETTVTAGAEETTAISDSDSVRGEFTASDGFKFNYEVNGNGNATLTSFYSPNEDSTESFTLNIPEKVTTDDNNELIVDEIGFIVSHLYYDTLKEVSIPATVTKIGDSAFVYCTALTTVTFAPNSNLTQIGPCAFENTGLTSITIPDKVTTLGSSSDNANAYFDGRCFANCTALETVILPNTLQKIGSQCFSGCTSLKDIGLQGDRPGTSNKCLPNDLSYLGSRAFEECSSLEEITIPGGVETIQESTFLRCISLKRVNSNPPSEGLKTIEDGAFYECPALEAIYLPKSTTTIAPIENVNGPFGHGTLSRSNNLTIYGYRDSYTEECYKTYAERNQDDIQIRFEYIDGTPGEVVSTTSRVTSSTSSTSSTSPTVTSPQTGAKSPVLGSMSLVVLGGAVAGFAGVISQKRKKED